MDNHVPEIQSAHAILVCSHGYVLQLRDDKPTIAAPGQWSLFGGVRNKDETPMSAIKREILEELVIEPSKFQYLWFSDYYSDFEAAIIRTWFFVSDVGNVWPGHGLTEGQRAEIFKFEQLGGLVMPPIMKAAIERYHATR